ncbi:MAG: hypothetical protein FJY88_11830, partial [Candidatus Eisenbacteria bacterium]|nr:hypothetical protein [Candidatus Eisenbacteria bacterium]
MRRQDLGVMRIPRLRPRKRIDGGPARPAAWAIALHVAALAGFAAGPAAGLAAGPAADPTAASTTERTEAPPSALPIAVEACPQGDFYFTLRTAAARDSSRAAIPADLRDAGARLGALTEFLPDSLPLRTKEGTVLIIHRKSRKYREDVERLLWRRLDPALSGRFSTEDIPYTLGGIRDAMRPLCKTKADSIYDVLSDIYRSTYPGYLTALWPARQDDLNAWIGSICGRLGDRQPLLLERLSRDLRVSLAGPGQLTLCVVTLAPPVEDVLFRPDPQRPAVLFVERRGEGVAAAIHLISGYLRGCRQARPADETALDVLRKTASAAGLNATAVEALETSMIDCAVAKALHDIAGIDPRDEAAGAEPESPPMREIRR